MADVVGTAYVRIKALTDKLAGDIEKGFTKGAKDANVDKVGEKIGDDLVKGASKKIERDSGDSFKNSLEKAVSAGNFKKASSLLSRKISDDFNASFGSNLRKAIDKDDYDGAFKLIAKKKSLERAAEKAAEGFGNAFKKKLSSFLGLEKDGENAGRRFERGFSRGGRFVRIAKVLLALTPIVQGAFSLLLQYVVALVSQVGLLAVAAAGAGIALGTVFAAAALSALPLFLAFKANTAQLIKFKEVAGKVGEAWQTVGAATQETLLPGLTRALTMTKKLIPQFRAFGREVGSVAAAFAEMTVKEVVGDQERLQTILQGSSVIFRNLAGVAFNFVKIFLNVFKAAIPIGIQFSEALRGMFERWSMLVEASSNSGRLTTVFQDWFDKATLVGKALGDLFAAIWNIFQVGSDSAVPFFENFATWAENFRAFTASESGQNRLKQIFDDANAVAHEFNGLLVDIGRAIGGAVFEPGGNGGIIAFIKLLREDVVPFLERTFRAVRDELGPTLKDLAGAFGDFLSKLGEGDTLKVFLETINQLLKTLTLLLGVPGFAEFIGFLGALAGVAGLLKSLGIISLFKSLGIAVGWLAGGFVELLATGSVSTFFAGLGGPVAGAAGVTLGAVALAVGAIVAAVAAAIIIFKNWDTIVKALKTAFNAFVGFLKDPMSRITALKENIENLLGSLGRLGGKVLGAVGRAFAKFGGIIKEKVEDAIGATVKFISKIPGVIGRALLGLGSALLGAFVKAVTTVAKALPGLLGKIIYFWAALPFRIVFGLLELGKILVKAFLTAIVTVGFWLAQTGIPKVVEFFSKLPGRIVGALDALGDTLREVFVRAIQAILNFFVSEGPKVLQFFKDLPGKIVSALSTLGSVLGKAFATAFNVVTGAISTFITKTVPGFGLDMLKAGSGLIGKLVEGLGKAISGTTDVAKQIVNGIIKFINNEIIHKINDLLEFDFKVRGIGFTVDAPDIKDIPLLKANGDIFRRATNIIAGEAGPEVLIPLTRPRRALELFEQSGLAAVLARAQGTSASGAPSVATGRGGVVFQEGAIQVTAQGVSATAVIDEMNAKLGWQLTTRRDR